MKNRIWVLLLLISSHAYSQEDIICPDTIEVIFANGIDNSKDEATESLKAIKQILEKQKTIQQVKIQYDIAYNYDDLLPLELLEAYEQKQLEKTESFWRWFLDWSSSPDWFKNIIYRYMGLYRKNILAYSNTEEQVNLYRNILEQNGKILTIAHSQGNLFSNEAFKELEKENLLQSKVVLVSVATPASYVYGSGQYFTLSSDFVINAVRIASKMFNLEEPLPANSRNIEPSQGRWDHYFVEYYWFSSPTGTNLVASATEAMNKLAQNKNNKDEDADFGRDCINWWNNLKIDKRDTQNCILECTTAEVGMSTFNCTRQCKYFCKCMVK